MEKLNHTVTLDFSKIIRNFKGEPAKDMIDQLPGTDPKTCPDLTMGSLFSNALMLGVNGVTPKEGHKMYQLAHEIDLACKSAEGLMEVDEGKLSQLEEAFTKVNSPIFTIPYYSGAVQDMINKAKVELLAKQKNSNSSI